MYFCLILNAGCAQDVPDANYVYREFTEKVADLDYYGKEHKVNSDFYFSLKSLNSFISLIILYKSRQRISKEL